MLFDAAWLWEDYLAGILPEEIRHSYAKLAGGMPIFTNRAGNIYPDFYSKELEIVLDAKYKHLDQSDISREDLYQLISYMYILQAKHGILLFPASKSTGGTCFTGDLNGYGGTLASYGLQVPQHNQARAFASFAEEMRQTERGLQEYLQSVVHEASA